MSHKRNPVGSKRRWREGKLHRLDDRAMAVYETGIVKGVANKLSIRLRERDIAASELAAALGVSEPAVMQWTAGREKPSLRRLLTIAKVLGCSLVDLLPDDAHLP